MQKTQNVPIMQKLCNDKRIKIEIKAELRPSKLKVGISWWINKTDYENATHKNQNKFSATRQLYTSKYNELIEHYEREAAVEAAEASGFCSQSTLIIQRTKNEQQ